jgi:hypothetical protein
MALQKIDAARKGCETPRFVINLINTPPSSLRLTSSMKFLQHFIKESKMPNPIRKRLFVYCPKSGRMIGINWPQRIPWFLFPVIGFFALIWILIRVIPKPSRANYPCVRAATPLALSFLGYVLSLCFIAVFLRKTAKALSNYRYSLAFNCIVIAGLGLFIYLNFSSEQSLSAFIPSDAPNMPIGTAKGAFPGRVVWVHDPDATSWDGSSNYWWDNNHTNPAVIESMMAKAVCWLTQKPTESSAWDSLFRQYNKTHGKGDVGYTAGQRIVIKPNHNNQLSHTSGGNSIPDTPPAVYVALLKQLVNKAGVAQNCITLCESSRYIDNKTYDACFALFPQVRYEETNFYLPQNNPGTNGRVMVVPVQNTIIWSSAAPIVNFPLAKAFVDADYVINLARMQGHGFAGVSMCAKNWYGCFCVNPDYAAALHNLVSAPQYNSYSPLVDLMGHKYLGGKTMLYLLDALWCFEINYSGYPTHFTYAPFNGDYPSSILMSQDPVAIDSVGLDFLRAQFALKTVPIDSYLHEAALAGNPPSGVFYDPEGDGTRLQNLGVHEHWNNSVAKQYSRNLGTGLGIELLYISPQTGGYYLLGDFNSDGLVNEVDLNLLTDQWLIQQGGANWDARVDIAPIGGDGKIDFKDFMGLASDWSNEP